MKVGGKQIGAGCAIALLLTAAAWQLRRFTPSAEPVPEKIQAPVPQEAVLSGTVSDQPDNGSSVPSRSGTIDTLTAAEASFEERIAAFKKLGGRLSGADIAALREFLKTPLSGFPDQRSIEINSIKNDVLVLLMKQQPFPEGLDEDLQTQLADPQTDPVWREYLLQFMVPLYERESAPDDERLTISKGIATNALFAALQVRDKELAGTALLALDRLSNKDEALSHEEIMQQAVEMAEDPDAFPSCRLTALRLAAGKGRADVLPVARALARNAETDLLRAAAIVTLGDFGGEEDILILQALSTSPSRQISAAAHSALKKLAQDPNLETKIASTVPGPVVHSSPLQYRRPLKK
jgi:hypothetical protein